MHCTTAPVHCATAPVHCATAPVHCTTAPVHCATAPVLCTTAPVHYITLQCTVKLLQCTVQLLQCTVQLLQCTVLYNCSSALYNAPVHCTTATVHCTTAPVHCTTAPVHCTTVSVYRKSPNSWYYIAPINIKHMHNIICVSNTNPLIISSQTKQAFRKYSEKECYFALLRYAEFLSSRGQFICKKPSIGKQHPKPRKQDSHKQGTTMTGLHTNDGKTASSPCHSPLCYTGQPKSWHVERLQAAQTEELIRFY